MSSGLVGLARSPPSGGSSISQADDRRGCRSGPFRFSVDRIDPVVHAELVGHHRPQAGSHPMMEAAGVVDPDASRLPSRVTTLTRGDRGRLGLGRWRTRWTRGSGTGWWWSGRCAPRARRVPKPDPGPGGSPRSATGRSTPAADPSGGQGQDERRRRTAAGDAWRPRSCPWSAHRWPVVAVGPGARVGCLPGPAASGRWCRCPGSRKHHEPEPTNSAPGPTEGIGGPGRGRSWPEIGWSEKRARA